MSDVGKMCWDKFKDCIIMNKCIMNDCHNLPISLLYCNEHNVDTSILDMMIIRYMHLTHNDREKKVDRDIVTEIKQHIIEYIKEEKEQEEEKQYYLEKYSLLNVVNSDGKKCNNPCSPFYQPDIIFTMLFKPLLFHSSNPCTGFTIKFNKTLSNTLWLVFWQLKAIHPTIIENYYEELAHLIKMNFDFIIEQLTINNTITVSECKIKGESIQLTTPVFRLDLHHC